MPNTAFLANRQTKKITAPADLVSFRRVVASLLAAVSVWTVDRLNKIWAVRSLDDSTPIQTFVPWLDFTLHRNTGAAFGLGSHAPQALAWFAAALTLLLTLVRLAVPGWLVSVVLHGL